MNARFRMGADVVFVERRGGVLFRTDGETFFLKGERVYAHVKRVAHLLTRARALREVVDLFDETSREEAAALLRELRARGVLRDEAPLEDPSLGNELRTRFASPLAFLADLADRPHQRFLRFREGRVLLAGAGASWNYCAAALERNGLRRLWLYDTCASSQERDARAASAPRDSAVERHLLSRADAEALSSSERPDLVAYVADRASLTDLTFLGRLLLRYGSRLLPGFVWEGRAVLGPMVSAPGCWLCAFLRIVESLSGRLLHLEFQRRVVETRGFLGPTAKVSAPMAKRIGTDIAFETFKALAGGLRPRLDGGMVLDHCGLQGRAVEFIPFTQHGCVAYCREVTDRIEEGNPETPL